MSSDTKLTKDEECELVDSTKYRGMIVTCPGDPYSDATQFGGVTEVRHHFLRDNVHQYRLSYSNEGQMFQILDIPCEGAYVFTDRWSLDELVYGTPSEGPYQTNLPSPDDSISYIREDREGQVTRIRHQEEDKDHVLACLCYMLYYVANSEKLNLAYYMAKRMEWVTKQARLYLPYGMLLTRLFKSIFDENPELQNESYVLYLATQLERNPRKDRGTKRGHHSTSASAFDQPSSSHLNDDDDDGNGEGTSLEYSFLDPAKPSAFS
ncbi:hypothetical protein Tco_0531150 [Tanacetum coccineum]